MRDEPSPDDLSAIIYFFILGKCTDPISYIFSLTTSPQSFIWGGQETPALVSTMDIKCDNGYIHVIDDVLIPYEGIVAPLHN